jgi:O-antigen ligase
MTTHLRTAAGILALGMAAAIPLSVAATTVISIILAITCIFSFDRKTLISVFKHPVTITILIFIAINIIACAYSIAESREISHAFRKYYRLLYFPLLLPLFTNMRWRNAAIVTFLVAVFISVIAAMLAQVVVFKDSIFTSLFVAFAIFTLVHYSIDSKKYRSLTVPVAIFFTYYLFFMNIGRAGQFIFVMLFILFMLQRLRYSFKYLCLAATLLIAIVAASILVPSSFAERQTIAVHEVQQYINSDEIAVPHESSLGTRLILARNSLELIKLKPIFGWGTGSFAAAYRQYAPEAQIKDVKRVNPHNQYLLTWVELGLPGLLSLLSIFCALAVVFYKSQQLTGYLGLGLVAAFAMGCSMNSWLLDFTSAYFFVFFAAVFAAYLPKTRK